MKKNKLIIFFILAIIIVFTIIFYLINNKKIEIGNNDNNQILNMNSYKAKIEVTVVSNKYMAENNLFLNEFIDDFNNSSNSKHEENENEIILSTDCKTQENKYQVKKKLTIDKKTNKPKKLEVQDINQNITVYILYNEISYK